MNPKKLSKRLKFIEATPLKDRASVKKMSRRDLNKVSDYENQHPHDDFDDFFKFEDDLADLKSSREQFAMMEDFQEKEDSFSPTILEQNTIDDSSRNSFVIMENDSKIAATIPLPSDSDSDTQSETKSGGTKKRHKRRKKTRKKKRKRSRKKTRKKKRSKKKRTRKAIAK